MAKGRVCTGFSAPFVALYSAAGGVVTYSSGQALARGVSVELEIEAGDDNNFYADNVVAESSAGEFVSGTCTLTVDGLKDAARKLILGLPTADADGFVHYGDSSIIPYVGIGYIARFMEDGVTSYVPTIIPKAKFAVPGQSASTQEDSIEWQTEELTASIFRDDTANKDWLLQGSDYATEALAQAALESVLNA